MGVPTLGCECRVCTSADPHDRRMRPSVALTWPGHSIVFDTGPDFRLQALTHGIRNVDAVFYTHGHADHILGLDDLRPLSFGRKERLPLYADDATAEVIERIYPYTFAPDATYPNRARVAMHRIRDHESVEAAGVRVQRIPLLHGELATAGFRFGDTAYLTDMSSIPETSLPLLEGLEHVILDALRREPHPSHANLEQAMHWGIRLGARHVWFTHMSHDLQHEETNRELPAHMRLAYDGLEIPVSL